MTKDSKEHPGIGEPVANDSGAIATNGDRAPAHEASPDCELYMRGLEGALDDWSSDADEAAWRDL